MKLGGHPAVIPVAGTLVIRGRIARNVYALDRVTRLEPAGRIAGDLSAIGRSLELAGAVGLVTGLAERRINPQRVRDIFLGLNDGLVEILGAVSGFFAAFADSATVLVAGSTVAVAGALSMAAGAYVAVGSESEVQQMEQGRARFLSGGDDLPPAKPAESAAASALVVGVSYLAGALVPVLPVVLGARTALASLLAAGTLIILVSMLLAFLSGMDVRRRVLTNLVIIAAAVGVTYAIGIVARALWGISI